MLVSYLSKLLVRITSTYDNVGKVQQGRIQANRYNYSLKFNNFALVVHMFMLSWKVEGIVTIREKTFEE